jgi:hypothetical protein
MTEDTRKTWYWTGGVTAAIVAAIVALWLAGVFEAPTAVQ